MPELPEVETIAHGLRSGNASHPSILGRQIWRADVLWARTVVAPSPAEFARRIAGQTIIAISRRGKFLLFELSGDWLLVHLRMSGDLWVEPAGAPVAKHHRLALYLEGDLRLAFNDTRKFGRVWLTDEPQSVLGKLGPEPFDPALDAADFHRRLRASRRQLKPLLMDQSFLAGMGNIYTDEALYAARLHPLKRASDLSLAQAEALLKSIRTVLQSGIRHHGASIDWVYRGGDFQNFFQVYRRAGQPCRVCGTPIERQLVGQRSTHFCPRCQPLHSDPAALDTAQGG